MRSTGRTRPLGHPGAPTRRAGAPNQGGQEAQALGRSRGGFGTLIPAAAADERTALALVLTPGPAADAPIDPERIATVLEEGPGDAAAADKSYESDAIRSDLKEREIEPVIPVVAGPKEAIPYDKKTDRQRNRVERLFNKRKQFRRIASRYDRLDLSFLAFIHLTNALLMIR